MNTTSKPLRRTLLVSTVIAALSLPFGSVWANGQTTVAGSDGTTPASGGEKAGKTGTTTLTSIIVTAEKRSQNVRDVPSSISVVSAEKLQNEHISSLVDLAGSLPGVQISSGGTPGQTAISIRGISSLGGGR